MLDFSLVKEWQKKAYASLEQALKSDHLPHAVVFISPGDVGEKELAEALADRLVCEDPGEGLCSCGKCSGCHLRSQGTHPDVYYVRPVGRMRAISPESMGEMMTNLQTKSLKGRAKVVIIEQAEALTRESANKFLKTLEEPSSKTYFILLTTRGERLLPTIRSRCQIIRLVPLTESDMLYVCKNELKQKRRKDTSLDEQTDLAAPETHQSSEIMEAVTALPEKYKTVIYLYYYEGYQTAEIAEMLKKPYSTIRNHLREARLLLKERLGDII